MQQLHACCAGIDIHKDTLAVCVLIEDGPATVQSFGATSREILRLGDWLTGHFTAHHRFMVQALLRQIDHIDEQIESFDGRIEEVMSPMELAAVTQLDEVPGFDRRTAQNVIAEIGTDMSRFPTDRNLASWAGLCPGNDESAGKRRSGKTRHAKSQRGISRRGEPSRYPMRLRIFDMSDRCGFPMYAKTHGDRVTYACSKYMRSSGKECNRNAVDGEAAFQFALAFLQRNLNHLGALEGLRSRLASLAAADQAESAPNSQELKIQELETSLLTAERELGTIKHNLARTAGQDFFQSAIAEEYTTQREKASGIQARLTEAKASRPRQQKRNPGDEVQAALALFDQLEVVSTDPTARASAAKLFETINLRLWLNFRDGVKGKRKVRVLTGGILTTGNGATPVSPYGLVNDDPGQHSGDGLLPTPGGDQSPSADLVSPSEGVSLPIGDHGVP